MKKPGAWLVCALIMLALLPVSAALAESDPTITLTTTQTKGLTIMLSIQPASGVWIDLNNDGIQDSGENNIGNYKSYTVDNQTITIHGNVTVLTCRGNKLSAIDVTHNTTLNKLDVWNNQLTALDVTQNTLLTELNCESNQIALLDITRNTALTKLNVGKNQLAALDLTQNTRITTLGCALNQLTALDLTHCPGLQVLTCSGNGIQTLDLALNPALTELYCDNNLLESMVFPGNPWLARLTCSGNLITTLNVSQNPALMVLDCGDNRLSSLDLSNNPGLKSLRMYRNQIAGADMTACANGLANRIAADHARLYILDSTAADEDNIASIIDVALATGKNWSVYDNNGGSEIVYSGSSAPVPATPTDAVAILLINNKTPSLDNQWRIRVTTLTLKGGEGTDLTDNITLSGLPGGLTYNAVNGGNNVIVITLSGAATASLTADAQISATVKGHAVTAQSALDSEPLTLDLWYIGPGTTFVLSNESGGLIDDLITAGYGNSNLYQTLVSLAPASGGVITERFLETLANCPPGSEIFTAKLSDFAGLNNPVGVNIDGTLVISSIFGRDYFGETGYATYPNTPAYGELFTYATSELYYIDTGSTVIDSDYENYQAFAIAWTVEPELKVNQSVIRKPAGSQHTVTASLAFEGVPNQGVRIDFLITDGPNAGKSGSQLTDINGQARFTYIGDHGAGQDTILVTAFDQTGSPLDSVQTTRDWSGAPSGVGGEVATVNRLDLLTPWMFFILMLFTGGTILALRNHKKTK